MNFDIFLMILVLLLLGCIVSVVRKDHENLEKYYTPDENEE